MEERVIGHCGGGEGESGTEEGGEREEEVMARGERFKWPSHTVVNLPKTSSASRQGLSARRRGEVQGGGVAGLRVVGNI